MEAPGRRRKKSLNKEEEKIEHIEKEKDEGVILNWGLRK